MFQFENIVLLVIPIFKVFKFLLSKIEFQKKAILLGELMKFFSVFDQFRPFVCTMGVKV